MKDESQRKKPLPPRWTAYLFTAVMAGCAGGVFDRDGVRGTSGASSQRVDIPKEYYPPPGKCRIWRPGMNPVLQPAPGDCDQLKDRVPEGAVLVRG